ncbi:hypothetical protein TH61_02555 [Rufibacter sp. DG15C]|uniref:DUF2254 domain-containing protein n=1 Tax=Rufibacter sp. DG15C TaxID=1379909 RepID=UPI00078C9431|nr:DUF2254 domain-containing protein [Rufibacter sp. DG15C]AMM50284.1 hypothetical protein TH61_02555 [Rufibacter sp. DG15C]
MTEKIRTYVRRYYTQVVTSIAFYPAVIALVFLIISYTMLHIDFSESGRALKSRWDFLTLKDASTARTIAATIAGGILSLTVFSFSMVMILLNQAASNMSNRVLDSMIGNRFQQWVLGFYIGTIVYALFLLSTIRDIDSGVLVPALSVYLLILLTVVDIFLFIYFLHYITQSVKYDTIIDRIHKQTRQKLEELCPLKQVPGEVAPIIMPGYALIAKTSGYYQGFNQKALLRLCTQHQWQVVVLFPIGAYVLDGIPFLRVHSHTPVTAEQETALRLLVEFYRGESILISAYYGFKQLVEVALKALSPGVNDPGTAVLSLQVLVDLLSFQLNHYPRQVIQDADGGGRIFIRVKTFEEIFEETLLPIWDYGQEDRILQIELEKLLQQLQSQVEGQERSACIRSLLHRVEQKAEEKNKT